MIRHWQTRVLTKTHTHILTHKCLHISKVSKIKTVDSMVYRKQNEPKQLANRCRSRPAHTRTQKAKEQKGGRKS